MLPTPPPPICVKNRLPENRVKQTSANFTLFKIINLIDQYVPYEVWSHYKYRISSQCRYPQDAISIKCSWEDFERVFEQSSKERKRVQWLIWGLDFSWV
jgi:hypothetical protein